jgi:hypothetical protein
MLDEIPTGVHGPTCTRRSPRCRRRPRAPSLRFGGKRKERSQSSTLRVAACRLSSMARDPRTPCDVDRCVGVAHRCVMLNAAFRYQGLFEPANAEKVSGMSGQRADIIETTTRMAVLADQPQLEPTAEMPAMTALPCRLPARCEAEVRRTSQADDSGRLRRRCRCARVRRRRNRSGRYGAGTPTRGRRVTR